MRRAWRYLVRSGAAGPALWAVLAALMYVPLLKTGLSNDEGLFAVQAERILSGQIPHRDFAITYIGGNVLWVAFMFLLLGKSILALRLGVMIMLMICSAALYYLARQLVPPRWAHAALFMILPVTFSFYPFSSASWDALAFSLLAFSALIHGFRHAGFQHGKRLVAWLFISGVCTGISLLMKHTIALYTGFAVFVILLFFVRWQPGEKERGSGAPGGWWEMAGKALIGAGTLLIPAYLFYITQGHLTPGVLVMVIAPPLVILWIAVNGARQHRQSIRFGLWGRWITAYIAGSVLVFGFYLLPFLFHHAADDLLYRVLIVQPGIHLGLLFRQYPLHPVALAMIGLALSGGWLLGRKRPLGWLLAGAALLVFWITTASSFSNLILGTLAMLMQVPLWTLLVGGLLFFRRGPLAESDRLPAMVWIYGAMMMIGTYPLFLYPYFSFSATPLLLLAVYLLYRWHRTHPGYAPKAVAAVFLAYWGIFGLINLYGMLSLYSRALYWPPLSEHTGHIRYPKGELWLEKAHYRRLSSWLAFVERFSKRPDDFYILGDLGMMVYFLTDRQNPAPYDYHMHSLAGDGSDIAAALEEHRTTYILWIGLQQSHMLDERFKVQPKLARYIHTHYRPFVRLEGADVYRRADPAAES